MLKKQGGSPLSIYYDFSLFRASGATQNKCIRAKTAYNANQYIKKENSYIIFCHSLNNLIISTANNKVNNM